MENLYFFTEETAKEIDDKSLFFIEKIAKEIDEKTLRCVEGKPIDAKNKRIGNVADAKDNTNVVNR